MASVMATVIGLVIGLVIAGSGCSPGGRDGASRPLPGPEAVIGREGRSPGRFVHPRGVAYHEPSDSLCVVDRSGRIQRFVQRPPEDRPGGEPRWEFVLEWTLPEHELGQPTRIHFDRDGRLLVADTHYQRIRIYDPETGELVRSWGRAGTGDGEFSQVRDVARDGGGNYYVGDYGGLTDRVMKFDAQERLILTFGRRGEAPGEFRRIQGLAVARDRDGRETLLVVDSCNHRIQRFTLDGRFLETWGGPGEAPGQFNFPYGMALEDRADGDIFIVEWGNNRVQRFDSKGRWLATWGRAGREPGELATPWDIALAPDGRVFVADYNNHRVQVFRAPRSLARTEPARGAVSGGGRGDP